MKFKNVLVLLAFLAIAPLGSRAAAVDYFLKIEGIAGESTDARHKGEIDILRFSWGVSNLGAPSGGGGGGSGKVQVSDLNIIKKTDKSTTKLIDSCAKGTHIKKAILTVRRSNGKNGTEILVITLEDVTIGSFRVEGAVDEIPTEALTLIFNKIEIKTTTEPPVTIGTRQEV